ncbi:MAG TPA: lipid-A-disaccharide synthase [Gemmatimonadaceae bacterium]|nr:lipid-A-disaccharide synthase [Gemmatimonadaceae bacterium]
MREILFVAGEVSGDLHAAAVARALREAGAPFALVGVGGDAMREAGVELMEHTVSSAVMGFIAPIRHLPRLARLRRLLRDRIRSGRVALVILIDSAGFNMGVAAAATAAGVPTLYFITPQVWASRAGRMAALARTVTRAAVILPFEEQLLRDHGVNATFVGHPLLDRARDLPDRAEARRALGLDPGKPVLALFPGSRAQEIARHLDPFVAAARALQRRDPSLQVIVSSAPHVAIPVARCPFPLVHAASFTVFRAADAALCKSGTTTLEAAIAGCPLVVAYHTSALEYALAKRIVKIPFIGLVNIVAGRAIAPELVQDALTPQALTQAVEPLLDHHSAERAAQVEALREVRESLGETGAATRVAAMALELARGAPAPATA